MTGDSWEDCAGISGAMGSAQHLEATLRRASVDADNDRESVSRELENRGVIASPAFEDGATNF
jgi:hypothetical protein